MMMVMTGHIKKGYIYARAAGEGGDDDDNDDEEGDGYDNDDLKKG